MSLIIVNRAELMFKNNLVNLIDGGFGGTEGDGLGEAVAFFSCSFYL